MKKLNWLIFRSFLGPMVMSLAVILFILILQLMAGVMDEIAGKGISLSVVGKLFAYACGKLFLLALPVAVLAAALMTYGKLGEQNELAALKSSGIGLLKIGRPMFYVGLILTGIAFWFSFEVVPKSNLKFFNLLYDVGKMKAELSLKPGEFYRDIDNYVIRISDRNVERKTLYDIMIYNHSDKRGAVDVIAADSARMRLNKNDPTSLNMVLYAGVRHEEFKPEPGDKAIHNYGRTYFDSLLYHFKLQGFDFDSTDEGLFSHHQSTLNQINLGTALDTLFLQKLRMQRIDNNNISQYTAVDSFRRSPSRPLNIWDSLPSSDSLFVATNQVEAIQFALIRARSVKNYVAKLPEKYFKKQKIINQYLYEYHSRIVVPLNVLFFMLIGIALGAIIRKGGLGVPALISTFLLVLAYILNTQGKKMAKEGLLDPVWSAWLPAILFGGLALFLLYKATNESRLLDLDSWKFRSGRRFSLILLKRKCQEIPKQ